MTVILLALRWFYNILVALILIRAFGSWFIRNPYGSRWYSLVIQMTEPILAPCRNLIARFVRGIPGVDFRKNCKKWIARITVNGDRIFLGKFDTFEEAVQARIEAENKYFGEYSYWNSISLSKS